MADTDSRELLLTAVPGLAVYRFMLLLIRFSHLRDRRWQGPRTPGGQRELRFHLLREHALWKIPQLSEDNR